MVIGKKYWYNKETKAKSWTNPNLPSKPTTKEVASKPKSPADTEGALLKTEDKANQQPAASSSANAKTPAAATASVDTSNKASAAPVASKDTRKASAVSATAKDNGAKAPAVTASPLWKEYTLDSGKKYWYNRTTKEKTWKDPNALSTSAAKDSVFATPGATVPSKASATKPPAPVPQPKAPSASQDIKAPAAKPTTADAASTKKNVSAGPPKSASPAILSSAQKPGSEAAKTPLSLPATHGSAPPAERNRDVLGTGAVHGTAPDEHVTVEVKSKKKNWRGALDVGLKVLDSALDRAKKGEDLEKSSGHAPIAKGPVAKEAAESAPVGASKSATQAKEPVAGAVHDTKASIAKSAPQNDTKEERPKAHSKLSWKSPFKKHAADLPPTEQEASREIDNSAEGESNHIVASKQAPLTSVAALSPAFKQTARSQPGYSKGSDDQYDISGTQHAPAPQRPSAGKSVAAAVGGAVTGAAGYNAYSGYEQGGDTDAESIPPSPPSEGEFIDIPGFPSPSTDGGDVMQPSPPEGDDESVPPSPPAEEDVEEGSGILAARDDDSAPSSPPLGDNDENASGPPSPAADDNTESTSALPSPSASASDVGDQEDDNPDYTTYAFEQPPSPADSDPPTPPAQEDSEDNEGQAAPSPTDSASPQAPASPTQSASPQATASPAKSASPEPPASPSPPASPEPADDSD